MVSRKGREKRRKGRNFEKTPFFASETRTRDHYFPFHFAAAVSVARSPFLLLQRRAERRDSLEGDDEDVGVSGDSEEGER